MFILKSIKGPQKTGRRWRNDDQLRNESNSRLYRLLIVISLMSKCHLLFSHGINNKRLSELLSQILQSYLSLTPLLAH